MLNIALSLLVSVALSGWLCHYLARKKGHRPSLWAGLGILLGPVGVIFASLGRPADGYPKNAGDIALPITLYFFAIISTFIVIDVYFPMLD